MLMREQFMKSLTDEERLDLYRKSLVHAWGFVDYNDWPIKLNSVFHLFLNEFSEEILSDISYLEQEKNYSITSIAKLMGNPARIYRIIDTTIYGMRRKRYSLKEQRNITLKLLSMVRSLKYGSEFNEDGKNIILPPEKVTDLITHCPQKRCSVEDSTFIHRFCGIMWAYTESIFFRAHDVTKEIHGSYNCNNRNIIIKEYLNLHPTDIWSNVKLLPCNKIKIIKYYSEDIKLTIDALNHLYNKGGLPIPNLVNYIIEIDDKEVSIHALRELAPIVQQTISTITSKINAMTWHEKVLKYAEIFWYRKRPLREARGLSWRLSQSIKKQIYAGKENARRLNRLSEEQVCRLAKLTI